MHGGEDNNNVVFLEILTCSLDFQGGQLLIQCSGQGYFKTRDNRYLVALLVDEHHG